MNTLLKMAQYLPTKEQESITMQKSAQLATAMKTLAKGLFSASKGLPKATKALVDSSKAYSALRAAAPASAKTLKALGVAKGNLKAVGKGLILPSAAGLGGVLGYKYINHKTEPTPEEVMAAINGGM